MIYLVFVLALCKFTIAQYWQHGVQDTPEVAAAKVAHFAAVEKAKLSTSTNHLSGLYKKPTKYTWKNENYRPGTKYNGPIAIPPGYDKNGAPLPVHDTAEVAAEKAKHFALVARSISTDQQNHFNQHQTGSTFNLDYSETPFHVNSGINNQYGHYRQKRSLGFDSQHGFHTGHHFQQPLFFAHGTINKYSGPVALPPGFDKYGAPLPVLDTPEVATAKAKHLAIVAKERAWHQEHLLDDNHYDDGSGNQFNGGNHGLTADFHGEGDYSTQTHAGHQTDWIPSTGHYGSDWIPSTGHYGSDDSDSKYHGPIAVSPGYDKYGAPLPVLDTPEVAAAKAHHFDAYSKIASQHQIARSYHRIY